MFGDVYFLFWKLVGHIYLCHRRWMEVIFSPLSVCLWAWYLKKNYEWIERKLCGQVGCLPMTNLFDFSVDPDPVLRIFFKLLKILCSHFSLSHPLFCGVILLCPSMSHIHLGFPSLCVHVLFVVLNPAHLNTILMSFNQPHYNWVHVLTITLDINPLFTH